MLFWAAAAPIEISVESPAACARRDGIKASSQRHPQPQQLVWRLGKNPMFHGVRRGVARRGGGTLSMTSSYLPARG